MKERPVSVIIFPGVLVLGLAHGTVGRVAKTNFFETAYDSGSILSLSCEELIILCCTPNVG